MAVGQQFDDMDVMIFPPGHPDGLSAVVAPDGKLMMATYPHDADLIVLQRPTHNQLAQCVPWLRDRGVAVVVDIDDDLGAVHPSNPAWLWMHPKTSTVHNWKNVAQACRDATVTTVSSTSLQQRYGRNPVLLPNCIPEIYLTVPHEDSDVIAWAGSLHSHPEDMKPLGAAIRRLTDDGAKFMVVGNGEGGRHHLNLVEDPPYTGPIDFGQWISAVTQIGIGIAPLQDTRFNDAKSWLKPLEYSAVGVPWVASPRAEYVRLHKQGVGFMADRWRDWERHLRTLRSSPALRAEQGEAGREVARKWTYEANAWRWAEVWRHAVEIEHSTNRPGRTRSDQEPMPGSFRSLLEGGTGEPTRPGGQG
jgi:hypothetical protein